MFSATFVTGIFLIVLLIWSLTAVTTLPMLLSAILDIQSLTDKCFCFDHLVDCSSRGKTTVSPQDICVTSPRVLDISWNALNSTGVLCQTFNDYSVLCEMPTLFVDELQVFRVRGNKLHQFSAHGDAYQQLKILDLSLNRISHVFLRSLDKLEILDFSFNNLTIVPWSDLRMSMPNIRELDLSHNFISLKGLGEFHFAYKLQRLNLSYNNISVFYKHGTEDLYRLETLDLSHNPFNISDYGFSSLRNLKYLNVSQANINEIRTEHFHCLVSLQILDISYNKLIYLPKAVFRHLIHLQHLLLSHNEITVTEFTEIGDEQDPFPECNTVNSDPPLRFLGELKSLDLSHNKIYGIKSRTFSALHNLRALNMSNNALDYIAAEAFLLLEKLMILDLSYNQLTFLPTGWFAGPSNLIYLNVSHNMLMSLGDGGAFLEMGGLRALDASWNFVAELSEGALRPLERLESLDVSWNVLRRAPATVFHTLRALRYLNVANNQLRSVPEDLLRNCRIEVSFDGNELDAPPRACSPQDILTYARLERAMYWPTAYLPPLPWVVLLAAAVAFAALLNRCTARVSTRWLVILE